MIWIRVGRAMPAFRLPPAVSIHVLVAAFAMTAIVGCSTSAIVSPTATPAAASASASTTPSIGPIDHPTGASDVVLRFEEGGGFVAPGIIATQAPSFSLYGDGTVVFRNVLQAPEDRGDGIGRGVAFRIARLSEGQIQKVLDRAINEGALGIARARYDSGMIADAPTATFTLNAGGLTKTVSVMALGMEATPGVDSATLKALSGLGELLRNFDAAEGGAGEPYQPERFRGVLNDAGGPNRGARQWPWPDIKPTDFVAPAGQNGIAFARRVLTSADVGKLGIADVAGGVMGIVLTGPDGKTYSLDLRPLLPDELS
jgi:hypothetical protein